MRFSSFLYFLIVLFSHTIVAHSQYESIISEESTYWNFFYQQYTAENTFCVKDSIVVKGDTLIDGEQYHTLITYKETYGGIPEINRICFIKEDLINGKVWYFDNKFPYNGDKTKQILSIDFSLNIGDTFSLPIRNIEDGSIIDYFKIIVDSVYYIDEIKHIRFNNLSSSLTNEKFMFLEGVGSTYGFDYNIFKSNIFLRNQFKDGSENFAVDSKIYEDLCQSSTNGLHDLNKYSNNELKIFPNPISFGNININSNIEDKFKFELKNLKGQIIQKGEFQKETIINLDNIKSGIYFMIFYGESQSGRIVNKIIKL